jgi:Acetyltransferase (GNAT) domain
MTAVDALELLADEAWDAALASAGTDYRFSHRAAAGRAFEAAYEEYSFEPYRVAYADGAVALVPLVRVRRRLAAMTMMMGMPLGLEGTPIALEGSLGPGHMEGLFDALKACARLRLHGGAGGSPPANGRAEHLTTHVLDLRPGFETVWTDAFTSKNRNMVRKAEKRGLRVARETSQERADDYYDIYAAASQRWGYDAPPYPRALFRELVACGHAELWLAYDDDGPVSGAFLLDGSDDLLYWSGATVPGKQALAPSNALLSEAIKAACERDVSYLDFGASQGLPGVEKFKRSFGAQARDYRVVERRSLSYRVLERLPR